MISQHSDRAYPAARIITAAVLLGIGFALIARINGWIWPEAFFDARVFVRAIDNARAGHGPYDLIHGTNPGLQHMPLVYPPHIAWLVELIAATGLPTLVVEGLLFISILAGIAYGVWVSSRFFIDHTKAGLALGAGVFAALLGGAGMITLVTGNISGLLWGLAFGAAIHGFRTGNWTALHVIISIAVLFKPFFMALWIVPVLAAGWSWRQMWIGSAWACVAALPYVLSLLLLPDLSSQWFAVMASRHDVGDVGRGLYNLLYETRLGATGALAVHAIYALAMIAMAMFSPVRGPLRLAVLLIVAMAVNPRMNAYGYAFVAIPVFAVFSARIVDLFAGRGRYIALAFAIAASAASCLALVAGDGRSSMALVSLMGGAVILGTQWDRMKRFLPARQTQS